MDDGSPARPLDPRLARVIAHPLRQLLLLEYGEQVTSPSRVAAVLGERLNLVSYHTGVLVRNGFLELVRTEPRRGAKEHFYRTLMPGEIEDVDWGRLPPALRRTIVRRALEVFWRDATRALPRGGMDPPTTHVSRSFVTLDAQGRRELAALLRSTLVTAEDIGRASRERGAEERETELVILHFDRLSSP